MDILHITKLKEACTFAILRSTSMRFILTSIIIFTLFISCNNNIDAPKPFFNSGERNGIKCRINGKDWKSCSAGSLRGDYLDSYTGRYFVLAGNRWCNSDTFIGISIVIKTKSLDTGIFVLNKIDGASILVDYGNFVHYETNDTQKGSLHITELNKTKGICNGTFQIEARDIKGDSIIRITNGIFEDVYYNEY